MGAYFLWVKKVYIFHAGLITLMGSDTEHIILEIKKLSSEVNQNDDLFLE